MPVKIGRLERVVTLSSGEEINVEHLHESFGVNDGVVLEEYIRRRLGEDWEDIVKKSAHLNEAIGRLATAPNNYKISFEGTDPEGSHTFYAHFNYGGIAKKSKTLVREFIVKYDGKIESGILI